MSRRAERVLNRLSLERLIEGETIETMANRIGTTATTWNRLERNLTNPRPEMEQKLLEMFGVPWSILREPVDLRKAR